MTNVVSAFEARTQFGQILRLAKEKQRRFIIDRRGEPQAVIMGIRDFVRNFAPEPEVLQRIDEARRKARAPKLTLRQIDAEIRATRLARRSTNGAY